jgi:hypothetical protein
MELVQSIWLDEQNFRTCRSALKTSGCAFSISSKSTTWWGRRRTASVSLPPSPYPTYPGGAPMSLETEWRSMYSEQSTRIIASEEPNTWRGKRKI